MAVAGSLSHLPESKSKFKSKCKWRTKDSASQNSLHLLLPSIFPPKHDTHALLPGRKGASSHDNLKRAVRPSPSLGSGLMQILRPILLACAAAGLPASLAIAAPMAITPYSLSGNSESNGWLTINSSVFPGTGSFPGTTMWSPLGSTTGGNAVLEKLSNGSGGGPYAASGSMYFGGFSSTINNNGGSLGVTDSTPVANLSNIVYQLQIGEAWTYDFYNNVLPTLSYTTSSGTVTNISATNWSLLEQYDNGTVSMPTGEETVYINTYAMQWDLSGVTEDITSFTISFTGVQHGQVYSMQLDQSDTYIQAVPEPATGVMLGLGSVFFVWRLRRRKASRE